MICPVGILDPSSNNTMNFYASRLKKYCTVLEIFKFFWGHYRRKSAFFATSIFQQRHIRLDFNFCCKYVSCWPSIPKKISLNEWTVNELTNAARRPIKLSFFDILWICIFHEEIILGSWFFYQSDYSIRSLSGKKISSLLWSPHEIWKFAKY